MKRYNKNLNLLKKNYIYSESMEHDSCGVGLIASTEGKKTRKVVEYGIQALKAVWHRGAIDADGKTGDGAGIHIEIPTSFFKEKIENYGRQYDGGEICVGMIFLPRNDYNSQEKCKTLIETELLKKIIIFIGGGRYQLIQVCLGLKQSKQDQKLLKLFLNQMINL